MSKQYHTVYLDTETTGLNYHNDDEVLEISIIDQDGAILLDTLVKPIRKRSWPDAEKIHGIRPEMVIESPYPTLTELLPRVNTLLTQAENLVIYNKSYDLPFLSSAYKEAGITYPPLKIHCAMLKFAEIYGEWNDYRNEYKWQKLTTAAAHVGHQWEGQAHRALADCRATKSVWEWLVKKSDEQDGESDV